MTGKVLEGRDRIGRALGRVLVRYARTSHHFTNARVEIDGDRAVLRTYVYAYHRMTTGDVWHLWARLYDAMERRDGRWLIVDHKLTGVDSEPHRPDIGDAWYGGHEGHLAAGPIPVAAAIARQALAQALPATEAGLARVRGAAEGDGALPAGLKALFAAAAAAAKNDTATRRAAVFRAKTAEVPAEQAWAAAGALGLARGEAAAGRLVASILANYGSPEPGAAAPESFDGDAYFRGYFGGELPERVALLAEKAPAVFEGYGLLHGTALREGALEPKHAELLLCAVNAAEYQSAFVEIHARAAREAGATEAELVEAIVAMIPVAGVAARAASAGALAGG
jgi:alkylhydroperoxidase/carboxymuconolactone decarboxylase family protein YurZ